MRPAYAGLAGRPANAGARGITPPYRFSKPAPSSPADAGQPLAPNSRGQGTSPQEPESLTLFQFMIQTKVSA